MRYLAFCALIRLDDWFWPPNKTRSVLPRWRVRASDWCNNTAYRLEG